ncbi:uncharacterized protein [Physcomitrium patens]|uniref:uncharacterized protein isoform X1 n=1 Tax=Physcomitrium patens TaxID=3218 RepID=UPI003CCD5E18
MKSEVQAREIRQNLFIFTNRCGHLTISVLTCCPCAVKRVMVLPQSWITTKLTIGNFDCHCKPQLLQMKQEREAGFDQILYSIAFSTCREEKKEPQKEKAKSLSRKEQPFEEPSFTPHIQNEPQFIHSKIK